MSTVDDYVFLEKEEFDSLTDKQKWEFVDSLKIAIKDLQTMAEKNCSECEQYHLDPGDANINFMFEDWRECAKHCDECDKEDKRNMCFLQFELMSSLAEEMNSSRNKLNGLMKHLLKKDDEGRKLVESFIEDAKASRKSANELYG